MALRDLQADKVSVLELSLFEPTWERVISNDGDVMILRDVLDHEHALRAMHTLVATLPWRHDRIWLRGQSHPLPRLQQWFSDVGHYCYSGIRLDPIAWDPLVDTIRKIVSSHARTSFNSCLVNYYRDGADNVGWHADDEAELGPTPTIASISLGAERDFVLRHNLTRETIKIALPPGSLLVMRGSTQSHWQHSLPRRRHAGSRINLTFRDLRSADRS